MKFTKLVATGNDFIFIDARDATVVGELNLRRPEIARKVCARHLGVGADGMVFVENCSADDGSGYRWDFYNSDGSTAEMCGNATRCMGRWASHVLGASEIRFKTQAGWVVAKTEGGVVSSELSFIQAILSPLTYRSAGVDKVAQLVNTGVPHAVIEIEDISLAKRCLEDVRALRFHVGAGVRGANVTFLQALGANEFSTITFERGVEDFTISCGTGVLAAAAVGLARAGGNRARVHTPGGQLEVQYGENLKGVILKGPATLICEGELSKEVLG